MISIKIPHAVMQGYAKDIGVTVTNAINKMLRQDAKGKIRLLKCERLFYNSVALNAASFLGLTPAAIEQYFVKLRAANPDYVILASGGIATIVRHIPAGRQSHYQQIWDRKHDATGKKGECKCVFCAVSARARTVFSWSAFMAKDKPPAPAISMAGKFIKSVGLSVCPYCSRNHIAPLTEPKGTIYSPDLDHFYAQSIYPYFRLCLYNLVPSCSACNCRIKGAKDFLRSGYLHPYEHDAPEQLFLLEGPGIQNVQHIDPTQTVLRLNDAIGRRAKKSAEFFRLPLAYEAHLEQACHIADALRMIPNAALEERARLLKVDPSYLRLILNRSVGLPGDSYKHRVLGRLAHDMEQMFGTDPKPVCSKHM